MNNLSIDPVAYEQAVRTRLAPLTRFQQFHALRRAIDRLQTIHNIVGGTTEMRPDMTVQQFVAAYPTLAAKLTPLLSPYVVNNQLSKAGFDYFFSELWEPRDDILRNLAGEILRWMRTNASLDEFDPME